MFHLFRLLLIVYLCSLSFSSSAQPQAYLDSLEHLASIEKDAYTKSKILKDLAYAYIYSNPKKGVAHAKESLSIVPKDSLIAYAGVYNLLASLHGAQGYTQEALSYLDTALTIFTKIDDTKGIAKVYSNKANVYRLLSEYDSAAQYVYKGMVLNEQLKDTLGVAQNYTTLVSIAIVQNDNEKALEYGYKSVELYKQLNELSALAINYFNLGIIYEDLSAIDSVTYYTELALDIFKQQNDEASCAMVYDQLGRFYRKQKQLEIASIYLEKAIGLKQHLSIQKYLKLHLNLAALQFQLKNYTYSLELAQEALKQAQPLNFKKVVHDALEIIYSCYGVLGNFEKAFYYQEEFILLKDSILNENKQEQIKNLEIKYETKKKEQENQLLAQENQLLEKERDIEKLKAAKNLQFTYGALIGLLLVILIAYLILRDNKTKALQQTTQIKHQLLRNQMNPHFIFNSLNAIQSFVYKNEPRAAGKYLSSFAKLVRAILENSRDEYITLHKEIQWLENYLKLQLLRFDNKFDYHIDIDDELDMDSTLIPPMLTQPFIENALEHGLSQIDYQGQLDIKFHLTTDLLEVKVEDNGIGINSKTDTQKDHVSLATVITKERLDFLNKKSSLQINFNIEQLSPKGTVVTFRIPLKQNF
ncbi:MAG: tetratricopeptide repeat protein [Aureispira sp.]|nr:tetratricopeptide repeat protein [Aureispira sp.]